MNYLWGGMILVGILYGMVSGNMDAVTEAAVNSSKEAVNLCLVVAGVTALWMGIMRIAEVSGLIGSLQQRMRPLMHFLFPGIPEGHPAVQAMTVNMIANFLGLGWAATPAGLKAMEELAKLEEERRRVGIGGAETSFLKVRDRGRKAGDRGLPKGVASNEMCTFLILNISSLQLIPVNVIAYRSQYGSVNPTAIVGPGIAATAVSTAVAVIFCKVMDRKRRA